MSVDTQQDFLTTRWSVVLRAQSKDPGTADAPLAALCRQYWSPLYAFIRSRGHATQDAQDLTQEFFARFLEKRWLDAAVRSQGKLRSFLLTAVKRFLSNEWDRSRAAKRGGLHEITSIDTEEGEKLLASAVTLPEEPAFDRAWALTLLQATLRRLRAEYEQAGKLREYELIKPSLTALHGEIAYEAIAADLQVLPASARSLVHRLRKRFRELFREEVADTVGSPEEIDEEMRALVVSLGHL